MALDNDLLDRWLAATDQAHRDTIEELQDTLDRLRAVLLDTAELAALKDDVEGLRAEVQELEAALEGRDKEIAELKAKHAEFIASLRAFFGGSRGPLAATAAAAWAPAEAPAEATAP